MSENDDRFYLQLTHESGRISVLGVAEDITFHPLTLTFENAMFLGRLLKMCMPMEEFLIIEADPKPGSDFNPEIK